MRWGICELPRIPKRHYTDRRHCKCSRIDIVNRQFTERRGTHQWSGGRAHTTLIEGRTREGKANEHRTRRARFLVAARTTGGAELLHVWNAGSRCSSVCAPKHADVLVQARV